MAVGKWSQPLAQGSSGPSSNGQNQAGRGRGWGNWGAFSMWLFVAAAIAATPARAEEGSRYIHENGRTYRESTDVERVPESTTRMVRREETVYRPQYVTEFRETPRVVWSPVSEYRYEARWHNVLNPFRPAHLAYHMVPHTRWEARTETVRTPVTYRELVPETKTVEVPTRELRFVEREVTRRVSVTPTSRPLVSSGPARSSGQVGIALLEGDPPRRSTSPTVGRGGVTILR